MEAHELSYEDDVRLQKSGNISIDIKPIKIKDRTWGVYSIIACWIGMNICIPAYQMASSAIAMGIDWTMALLLVLIGNLLILIPIQLNSCVGVKYGISFPIYAKVSFGIKGARIPTTLRTIIGIVWSGILMWNGGESLYVILTAFIPRCRKIEMLVACFIIVWLMTVIIVCGGERFLKRFEGFCAPILLLVFGALVVIIACKLERMGMAFYEPLKCHEIIRDAKYWKKVLACLVANIAYYSTWALNIPDLSRYAKSQKSQLKGQLLGMPSSMLYIAFVGVYITGASELLFGKAIWNPNQIVTLLGNKILIIIFAFGIFLATMTTNVTTNLLPAANGILNLKPEKLSYRKATIIVGVAAIVIQPWKLVSDPTGYIHNWLGMYGILTGAVAGIFIVDYFLLRKQKIELIDLYLKSESCYWYKKGYNYNAVIAWGIAVFPSVVGFFWRPWHLITEWGWIVSFLIGALIYYLLMLGIGLINK